MKAIIGYPPVSLELIKNYNKPAKPNYEKSALIIIEMQKTFRSDLPIISDTQIKNIKSLIDFASKHNMKVIYVRHNESSKLSEPLINWWGDKLEYGSDRWQIMEEFDTTGQVIIDKNQYSAFYNTNLDEILKQNNIEDVIITGVMANCCCETAARDAFQRGYRVFFINDATATIEPDLHIATIKNLAFGFAHIINTEHILQDSQSILFHDNKTAKTEASNQIN